MTFNKSNVIVSGSRSSLSEYANYTTVYPKPAMVGGKIILTQDMINKQNVKYIIKWNFDLDDETITVPEGCLIEFDGGSFSNGTLVGNETILVYNQEEEDVFKNVSLEGSFERSTSAIADKMDNTNGMAKIYLKKNKPLATQLTQPNTIYVIQYDFTLGENITVPENCVLEFDGGSITGGVVFSNNTKIANIPSNLYIVGRIYNTNGQMITSKGDVINRNTRLVYAVSTLRKDSQTEWLYDEYGISTQIKGSTLIGITECYVDITLNISQNGTISFVDYIPDVNYIINYLKNQGIFNSVFAIRFNHTGYTTISPGLFMNNLKSFELNVIKQLKSAGLEFENVFFANEREDWVSVTTPENEYIPYLISIADAITELGYTPCIDSTNWYLLSEADTRLISHATPSYNFYPSISMLDENTIYNPDMINGILPASPAYGGLTYKDVGICESGVNSRKKALRNPSESDLTILGDYWGEAKIIFARVIKEFIDRYRIPFYGIWYTEGLTDIVDLEELYNIYLDY